MKVSILALITLSFAIFSYAAVAADGKDLHAQFLVFKKQSSQVQYDMQSIEGIIGKCGMYQEKIKGAIKQSQAGRAELVEITKKVEAIVASVGKPLDTNLAGVNAGAGGMDAAVDAAQHEEIATAGAMSSMAEIGAALQNALKPVMNPANQSGLRYALQCGNMGNPFVGKKLDTAIADYQSLVKTHATMQSYIAQQNVALSAYTAKASSVAQGLGSSITGP